MSRPSAPSLVRTPRPLGLAALIFWTCVLPSSAYAQTGGGKAAAQARNQFVSFDDDLLDANSSAPFGDRVFAGHLPPARTLLIRPRTNFVAELYKSVEQL